jgi:hypothetical protein
MAPGNRPHEMNSKIFGWPWKVWVKLWGPPNNEKKIVVGSRMVSHGPVVEPCRTLGS